ncbi:SET domain protein [Cordyceps fumosorosea ARSEF 2679]|uniref:SET domain protein n=1 Tax=Cordyceps fumosorosea (strain ARSEF 2679) TaxID=1081104 RepID=A0A167SYC5_CORFA|nr:SET domain protein [Cordyceps fumosorosea ARSEF 2679]OAA60059.1 SET domain protein [Cordyceps fumosorosea ARSEF 2679]
MESEIQDLLAWAKTKGIEINGCAPKQLHGRGLGIVATRELEENEVILRVPTNTLRSLANTPRDIVAQLPGASVHAILAAALCLDGDDEDGDNSSSSLGAWRGVLPSREDVHTLLPLCWPAELRALLPHKAAKLLSRQRANFQRDWAAVEAASFPSRPRRPTWDDFRHAWLLVNTRSFYHTTRGTATRPREDHMVLQPVADLFNHSPAAADVCEGSFDDAAFTITTRARHAPGDELFIKYGPHGNDFLLVEYGFALPPPLDAAWDETCLDEQLCPALAAVPGARQRLEEAGFWGGYMLDRQTACYRTHVALRALCLTPLRWRQVLDGERDEDADRERVDAALVGVLRRYEEDIAARIADVEGATAGEPLSREIMRDRWLQIQDLVVSTRRRLEE